MRIGPIALVLGVLALAGCDTPTAPRTLERLSVNETTRLQSYAFQGGCSASIGKADQKRMHDFLRQNTDPARDVIVVSVPRSCNARVDRQRQTALRALIGNSYGALRLVIGTPGDPVATRGVVRIAHIEGIAVDTTQCTVATNCSTAANLAAMVADPRDMFLPETGNSYWNHPPEMDLRTTANLTSDSLSGS